MPITWSDEVDDILAGDMTAGLAYPTPANGVVIIPMSPLGVRDRAAGTVTLSSTIAFPKKIERIRANPSLALAYHAREHGFSSRPEYVLVQGRATVGDRPDRAWLESITPDWERFFGPRRSGVLGRLLDVYYWQRIAITIDVRRIIVVDATTEQPTVLGAALPTTPPPAQSPPKNGTGPRVDSAKLAAYIARLPHTLLGWVGTDGFPMVVPVTSATVDQAGLHLQTKPDLLPPGHRRAGLLAHMFHPRSVGWEQRGYTGWLDVDDAGAHYAPHTAFGLATSPSTRTFEVVTAIVTNARARKGRKQALISGRQSDVGMPSFAGVSGIGLRAQPIAHVVRGGVVESVHAGHVVALDAAGALALSAGDPEVTFFPRSTLKPLQAVAMLRLGLELDGPLLALAAASHSGEPEHLRGVGQILERAGLAEDDLGNVADFPLDPDAGARWRAAGRGPARLAQNCSGKHAAMLATCVAAGWATDGYLDPDHPLQHAIRSTVEELTGVTAAHVTIDGCGAPLLSTTPVGLARAFARIATAEPGTAEGRVGAALRMHPWWVAGTDRDATLLVRAVPGLIAKDGADGVFAAALPDGRAMALKVLDGSSRPLPVVAAAVLRSLGAGGAALEAAGRVDVLGGGVPVGTVEPLVGLARHPAADS